MGLILVIIGGFLLFSHLDIIDIELPRYIYSWKMVLVVLGFVLLLSEKNKITGVILLLIGGVFLATDVFDTSLREVLKFVLPLFLIVLGLIIIFKRGFSGRRFAKSRDKLDAIDFINETNIFGGTEKAIKSDSFKGGQVTTIFGGADIDLTKSNLSDDTNVIEVQTIFGETSFVVPDDWTVKLEATAIFGSTSDNRVKKIENMTTNPDKLLIIRGTTIFGSIEIK